MYDPVYYQKNKERIKQVNLARYHANKTSTNPVGRPRKKYQFVPHPENNIKSNINGLLQMFDSNEAARPLHNSMPIVQSVFLPV
jgi:hypothetical protein